MLIDFDRMLRAYAELTVRVGLNLQPHQRLLIIGPVDNGGCSLESAPLVRQITAAAYDAGARLVETLWGDEALLGARLQHAPRDSSTSSPRGCRRRSSGTSNPVTQCSRFTPTIRIS